MSVEEADRAAVIRDVLEKRLRQREAAERLGIGVRQVKRLVKRYRKRGVAGLSSGRRGRRPNNAIADGVRRQVMDLVGERYADFGPTFAREKLVEAHGYRLSVETLRQWMIADGLWRAKARRAVRVHQSRARRECFGDLVQIDGSPHDWFEGRAPECTLIVYVDDATTRLLAMGFFPEETTEAYMRTTRAQLAAHGRPVAYYSDRYGVFRINKKGKEDELTQFTRALRTLDIAAIHAHSPQAKGRVERANQTLQDRLVKEMRLRGICDMEAGNAYLGEFMADFNRRFAVAPRNPAEAHREVLRDAAELDLILSEHHTRKLTKNLTMRFECREYQVTGRGKGYRLRGAAVTVCKAYDGSVTVLREGHELPVRLLAEGAEAVPVEDEKTVRGGWTRPSPNSSPDRRTSQLRTIPGGDRSSRMRPESPPVEGAVAPRPALGFGRSAPCAQGRPVPSPKRVAGTRPPNSQRGHLCFGEKGTSLLCVDTGTFSVAPAPKGSYPLGGGARTDRSLADSRFEDENWPRVIKSRIDFGGLWAVARRKT